MKRICLLLVVLLFCGLLVLPVSARSSAESMLIEADVGPNGTCIVEMTVDVTFDSGVDDPKFPIPAAASEISLNGGAATTTTRGEITWISLKRVGDGTFHLRYRLPAVVSTEKNGPMMLNLPLLSGFSYPIDDLQIKITFAGEVSGEPDFISGYYQSNTMSILKSRVEGNVVHGSAKDLMDHESLSLTMEVDEQMFPDAAKRVRVLSLADVAVALAAALAAVYYLLFFRPKLPKRRPRVTAPDGVTPGNTPLWLRGGRVDFSMMVVTWAQLGYLRIQVDDSGRVLLHKRMEMGNERSGFEYKCYRNLFGRRRVVDGTGYHYAQLCRMINKKRPQFKEVYRKSFGNPHVFRVLCMLPGTLGGILVAIGFADHSVFLRIFMAVLMTVLSALIHRMGAGIWGRNRLKLYIGLGASALWLLLGILSGKWMSAVLLILFQTVAGFAGSLGGKRTDPGQQALEQLMGLRRYMCTASKSELQMMLKQNPSYFHDMAPYALAMNADEAFARRFGRLRLPECTWLVSGVHGQVSAAEWAKLLRTAVNTLDTRAQRLPLERLITR